MLPKSPIRIATLGDWNNYFSYFLNGTMEGAIQNGCWFRPINIRMSKKQIRDNILEFRPHILMTHMLYSQVLKEPPETRNMLGKLKQKIDMKIYYHLGDARTEPRYPHNISNHVDGCLVNQTENLNKFSAIWNVPCYYWPYGCFYQDTIADPVEEFTYNLVFTGGLRDKGIHAHRTNFIRELQKKIPVKIYPDDKYSDTKLLTAEIAASARAILGVCAGYDIGGYMDVRPFQYPGAGGFLMQRYYRGMYKVILPYEHMIVFKSDDPAEFIELYRKWMDKPQEIERIRWAAFNFFQEHHSYYNRMKDVIDITFNNAERCKIFLEDL